MEISNELDVDTRESKKDTVEIEHNVNNNSALVLKGTTPPETDQENSLLKKFILEVFGRDAERFVNTRRLILLRNGRSQ